VTHWHEWTQAFWTTAFSWIGIHIHRSFVPLISFAAFLVMVVIGTILRTANPLHRSSNVMRSKAQLLKSVAVRLGIYVIWIVAFFGGAVGVMTLVVLTFGLSELATGLLALILYATLLLAPFPVVVWASKERLQCLALVTLVTLFWTVLAVTPIGLIMFGEQHASDSPEATLIMLAGFSAFALLTIGVIAIDLLAPVKSINQRLLFLAIGALLLVALNMISVLALHRLIEAPAHPL
jgi:hypothetical protein